MIDKLAKDETTRIVDAVYHRLFDDSQYRHHRKLETLYACLAFLLTGAAAATMSVAVGVIAVCAGILAAGHGDKKHACAVKLRALKG